MIQESTGEYTDSYANTNNQKVLADEIAKGIIELGFESKSELKGKIENLKLLAAKESDRIGTYNLLLYHNFYEIAKELKIGNSAIDTNNLFYNINTITNETKDTSKLNGWQEAKTSKMFWFRLAIAVLSLISFSVMASTPEIGYTKLHAHEALTNDCSAAFTSMKGYFDMRPYQLVLAIGVMLFVYSSCFVGYYLLPLDAGDSKYIPGIGCLLGVCRHHQEAIDYAMSRTYLFCTNYSKFIEVLLDSFFVAFTLFACLYASISLEGGAKFVMDNYLIEYYTLSTFYSTFTHTVPVCTDANYSPPIRASLAMLYFALFLSAITLKMSIEAFQKERKTFSSMFSSVNTATDDRGDATLLKSGTAGNKVPTADDEADV